MLRGKIGVGDFYRGELKMQFFLNWLFRKPRQKRKWSYFCFLFINQQTGPM